MESVGALRKLVRTWYLRLARPAANERGILLHNNRKDAAGWQSNLPDFLVYLKK